MIKKLMQRISIWLFRKSFNLQRVQLQRVQADTKTKGEKNYGKI